MLSYIFEKFYHDLGKIILEYALFKFFESTHVCHLSFFFGIIFCIAMYGVM